MFDLNDFTWQEASTLFENSAAAEADQHQNKLASCSHYICCLQYN